MCIVKQCSDCLEMNAVLIMDVLQVTAGVMLRVPGSYYTGSMNVDMLICISLQAYKLKQCSTRSAQTGSEMSINKIQKNRPENR
jgi:hypothetical protein